MSKKIRNLTDLQTEMMNEFTWRKKELHSLKTMVMVNEKNYKETLIIRAAVPLLYAHWEGFVKYIGTVYVEFVSRQGLKHKELASSFLAAEIGTRVKSMLASKKIHQCLEVVGFFRKQQEDKCFLEWGTSIQTQGNLSSDVLREIIATLGLDYSRFETKEKLLDERLLKNRNSIAHGRYLFVAFAEYIDLHDEMLALMQDFYDQVENAALMGAYRS